MVIPLLIATIINSVCPQILEIGGFTTAIFKTGKQTLVALFFVCSGAQISVTEAKTPVLKGTVLLVTKFIIGAGLGLLVSKLFGPWGVLGVTPLAIVSAVTNSNGSLYSALATEFGDETDVGAIGPLCINDSPFLTMVVFGVAGLADIPFMALVAAIFPLILGMILGNLDPDLKQFLKPGATVTIPFIAFCLGANLKLQSIVSAGLGGIVLGLITVIVTGFAGYYAIAVCNHGKPKAVGAAIGTAAGICSTTPVYIASIDPSLEPYVGVSVAACTAATIITAILCPILVAYLDKLDKKRALKAGTAQEQ